ncbi:MAG: Rieske 2Fe-2S domain-containing protein [Dehalococcoidia bacterium]|nr:Rieske 2Fe-2S domain-containing protein [Dehalococcoidia bacterium]
MANEPIQQSQSDAWKAALASRRTQVADSESVPAALVTPLDQDVSRRSFIRASFWAGLGVSLLGSVGLLVDYLYPRNVRGFGGPVPAGTLADYPVGAEPVANSEGQFWMVNLDPTDTSDAGSGGGSGLLALWRKCPHLGCTVPWKHNATVPGFDSGSWFQCPCHGSSYTVAGVRVYGPAARSMDTMAIEIDDAGNITVQTGQILPGGPDNPSRATPV